jgi:hypothetical protein
VLFTVREHLTAASDERLADCLGYGPGERVIR